MIDRQARLLRHEVRQTQMDVKSPLQIGNGDFSMTLDVTGMQTFEAEYRKHFALSTLSQNIWHCEPGLSPEEAFRTHPRDQIEVNGRKFRYLQPLRDDNSRTGNVLRRAMHRMNLGTLGLWRGGPIAPEEITRIDQKLNLWNAVATSSFHLNGVPVRVESVCGAAANEAAFRVTGLPEDTVLRLRFSRPVSEYGANGANWEHPELHESLLKAAPSGARIVRTADGTSYSVAVGIRNGSIREVAAHVFEIKAEAADRPLEVVLRFNDAPSDEAPAHDAAEVFDSAAKFWEKFWLSGGCCDFSGSTDPRAFELERRIVLSEYLTRLNCAGPCPPAESGLACNSWYGRFHLEMHWFHSVQFILWGRPELMERAMEFYLRILPFARALAAEQGYRGARLPKSVTPLGFPTANVIEIYLLWQQPHPIYYAELFYRVDPAGALAKYAVLVEQIAAFLADFFDYSPEDGRYHLGPPLIDAAEIYRDPMKNRDPNFETAYFLRALEIAQEWRTRRGLSRDELTDRILAAPPLPAVANGLYVAGRSAGDTFTGGRNYSHPMMLAPFAMFQGANFEEETMRRTLFAVLEKWEWNHESWGWDYPLTAMAAARLGEAAKAVEILLQDTMGNTYLPNGHNYQLWDMLPCYLPGNGSLLAAVAHIANSVTFDSIPNWKCRTEKLSALL